MFSDEPIPFRSSNAEREFREAERKKLTPTVTTLKRTRYYTTTHNELAVTTEIKEYTKKTTYVYPVGQKPPELDNISLKEGHVQEENKCSKKFKPIGSVELDVLYKANHPFDLSVDTDTHSVIYPLRHTSSNTSSFTSKDFVISSCENVISEKVYETTLNHPNREKELQFEASDRESVGPETCKVNRLSYNQAMRDERLKPDDSVTSSSSSSSSSSSGTFADSSSHASVGTHKKSFLPKFLNFCKGPDTHSIDGRTNDSPDTAPVSSNKDPDAADLPTCTSDKMSLAKSSIHSHGDNTTSSTTSEKSEKEVELEFSPPEIDIDLPTQSVPEVEAGVEAEVHTALPALSAPSLDHSLHSVTPPCLSIGKENVPSVPKLSEPSVEKPKPKKKPFGPFSLCTSKPLTTSMESLDLPQISEQSLSDLEHSCPELSSLKSVSAHSHKCDDSHLHGLGDLPEVPMVVTGVPVWADLKIDSPQIGYRIPGVCLGPDGTIYGPDGAPFDAPEYEIDAEGKPVLGPEGHLIGPDGTPILGLDGEPIADWNTILPDGTILGADGTPLLGPDGEPLKVGLDADGKLMIGPDGVLLGPDGKPLCPAVTPTLDNTTIAPDGTLFGPDGKPLLGLDGKPLVCGFDPEGLPLRSPEGALLGPDGKPILGLDGEPIVDCNTILPDGTILGPDGTPLLRPDGEPLKVGLDADGKLMLGPDGALLGPDGKPLCGPDVNLGNTIAPDGTLFGPDGAPILGLDGKPLVCGFDPDGLPLRSPEGALLGPDGIELVAAGPTLETPSYELDCLKSGSIKSLDVGVGVHAADRAGAPELDLSIKGPELSAQVKTPLDIFPKARRLKEPKKPKINPFKPGNLCGGRDKSDSLSAEPPVAPKRKKRSPLGGCMGGVGSPDLTHVTKDYKDDTLTGDDQSLASLESFALTSSLVRDPPVPAINISSPKIDVDYDVELMPDVEIMPECELNLEAGAPRAITPSPLGEDTALELARGIDLEAPTSDHELDLSVAKPKPVLPTMSISKPLENDKLKSVDDDKSIGRVSSRLSAYPKVKDKKRFKLPGPCGGMKSPDLSSHMSLDAQITPPNSAEADVKPTKPNTFTACCGGNRPMSPKADIDIVPLTSPPAVPEPFTGTITAEAEVDVSPHVVSLTHSHDVSVPEKRRGSGVLGGLFDMFRGRKAKREDVPMARSHSIPASIYSSTESLYVVTYKIKKRRTQSCPPRKSKGGRTHITIECDYEDATAMMAPKYITDVINSIGQETDGEKVKILQPVPYHENLLKELKDFKKDEGRDVTESHIYTTCHCETGGRVSVGVSTECDIIQHEECVGEKVVYEG